MAEHPIQGMMGTTIEKLRTLVDASTIIGDPITVEPDTTIIPVSKVTFGFASGGTDVGAKASKDMFGGGSGAGISITPVSFLVINNGNVKSIQLLEHASTVDSVIAALPDLVDKLTAMIKKDNNKKDDSASDSEAGQE